MHRIYPLGILMLLSIMLVGCGNSTKHAKDIYQKLTDAATIEQNFAYKERQLQAANKKEHKIYNEMMQLDIKDFDQIKEKLDKAKQLNDKQEKLIEQSQTTFNDAYKQSLTIKSTISDMDDKEMKKIGKKLIQLINKRNETYASITNEYKSSIKLSKKVLEQLQKKQFNGTELDKKITSINEKHDKITKLADEFTVYTDKYNQAKDSYFKKTGIVS